MGSLLRQLLNHGYCTTALDGRALLVKAAHSSGFAIVVVFLFRFFFFFFFYTTFCAENVSIAVSLSGSQFCEDCCVCVVVLSCFSFVFSLAFEQCDDRFSCESVCRDILPPATLCDVCLFVLLGFGTLEACALVLSGVVLQGSVFTEGLETEEMPTVVAAACVALARRSCLFVGQDGFKTLRSQRAWVCISARVS